MAAPELFAIRYDKDGSEIKEIVRNPADIGVRCALPGWLQRMEITVKSSSRMDAYERYTSHLGHRVALRDTWGGLIADGWIYEVIPDGLFTHYIIAGGWKRMTDHKARTPGAGLYTDAYLKSLLAASAPAASSKHAGIGTTSTQLASDWEPRGTVQDVITELLQMGTSDNELLDFWFRSDPDVMNLEVRLPLPHLTPRAQGPGEPDWLLARRDVSDMSLSRHIWDLRNKVEWHFRRVSELTSDALAETTLAENALVQTTLATGIIAKTTCNVSAGAGATTIGVASTAAFAPGARVEIQMTTGHWHETHCTAVGAGTITIAEGVPSTVPWGAIVKTNSKYVTVSSPSGFAVGDEIGIVTDAGAVVYSTIEAISPGAGGWRLHVTGWLREQGNSPNPVFRVGNEITVANASGFDEGDEIEIELDSGATFRTTVWTMSGIIGNTLRLRDRLKEQASAGKVVRRATRILHVGNAIAGVGEEIEIQLDDGGWARMLVDSLPVHGQIKLVEPLWQQASSGNVVRNTQMALGGTLNSPESQDNYWVREWAEDSPDLDATSALQYATAIRNEYESPAQQSSFTVGTRWVSGANGGLWPVWYLLRQPGYVRIVDLLPALFADRPLTDKIATFFTAALDYDHSGRALRITPDAVAGDMRLDVLLQRYGIKVGQMIERARPRNTTGRRR